MTELRVSRYDQVSGIVVAALILLGSTVSVMLLVWMSGVTWKVTPAIPVTMDVGDGGDGRPQGAIGVEQELEVPAAEDISPPTEPATVEELLEAISLSPTFEVSTGVDASSPKGNPDGKEGGDPDGVGTGPIGKERGIPAWERWEVRLNASTTSEYAKQLDFFKTELAVAGGGKPVVTYVTNVSAQEPTTRTGKPQDEKRLRFMHRSGDLREADKKLLANAGVDTSGKVIFQFYSQETYDKLLALETIAMQPRKISDVRRTVFGVKEAGSGYEFFVISQEFR